MKKALQQFLIRIAPFFGLGIFLVLLAVGLVIFSYLLVIGAIVGLILFVVFWIYNKFTRRAPTPARSGRTIDHSKEED